MLFILSFDFVEKIQRSRKTILGAYNLVSILIKEANMSKDFYREPNNSNNNESKDLNGDYLDPTTSKLIQSQPKGLVDFISKQRQSVISIVNTGENKLKDITEEYQKTEQKFNRDVSEIVTDPKEKLLPGAIYTVVGIMAGSILTRKRTLLSKILVPTIFGLVCFDYNLPNTMSNLKSRIYQWQSKRFPVLTKKQDEMLMELNEGLQDVREFKSKVSSWWNSDKS